MRNKWKVRKAYFGKGWMAIPPGWVDVGFDCRSWRDAIALALSNFGRRT